MFAEREVLIWLNSIGITNLRIELLKDYYGDLREVWTLSSNSITNNKILNSEMIDKILKHRNNKFLEELIQGLQRHNIITTTILDGSYPKQLRHINDKPAVLYSKGDYQKEDELSIGIVGSRKATAYGKWACQKFTKELVHLGITIISGLATGIDSEAHKTAIEEGGRTIAVLGNGLDKVYPKSNFGLYKEIVNNGCIFTEHPMGTEPLSYNFPQRNRIISGLSLGIVVVEAKEKSGSLITAHHALDQGKDVFSVPGNINSIYSGGTNKLIKDGAKPLLDIEDLIEEIYEIQANINLIKKQSTCDYSSLSETEIKIMNIIKEGPIHSDVIVLQSGIDISTVISILTILELKGMIRELSSRTFAIC